MIKLVANKIKFMTIKSHHRSRYGVQGPDALAFFVSLLLVSIILFILKGGFFLILASLSALIGLSGIMMLLVESSSKYRVSLRNFLLELSTACQGQTVLDVGTGRGLLAIGFAKMGTKTHGIDIWSKADLWNNKPLKTMKNFKMEKVDVKLQYGDIRAIPFKNKTFDIVVSSYVVHNIHSSRQMRTAVKELARVTKTNGKLIIADINPFLGPGWSKKRWLIELSAAGFKAIKFQRFWLATVMTAKLGRK